MPTYRVEMDEHLTEWYNQESQLHREDGEPAVVYSNGYQEWWLNGVRIADNIEACSGKVVKINGVRYRLVREDE